MTTWSKTAFLVVGEGDGKFDDGDHVLFYAEGPHSWSYNSADKRFAHSHNLYADTNFYYLTIGTAAGKRIENMPPANNPTFTAFASRNYHYHEAELQNLIRSGRYWMGEKFDLITQRSFGFHLPDADPNGQIRLKINVAGRSDVTNSFIIRAGNTEVGNLDFGSVNITSNETLFYRRRIGSYTLPASAVTGDSLIITLVYNKGGSTRSEGWLDWIEVDYDQKLDVRNANLVNFSLAEGIGTNEVAEVAIANGSSNYRIWDITNPLSVVGREFTMQGNTMKFATDASEIKHFVAFKGGYRSPVSAVAITNQNLHQEEPIDYLIISFPGFLPQLKSCCFP